MDNAADAIAVDPIAVIPRVALADFHRDPADHVARLSRTGEPEVLTVDGRPELVVQSTAAYQALLDKAESVDSLQAIRQSWDQMQAGCTRPAEAFFREFAAEHGIDLDR